MNFSHDRDLSSSSPNERKQGKGAKHWKNFEQNKSIYQSTDTVRKATLFKQLILKTANKDDVHDHIVWIFLLI